MYFLVKRLELSCEHDQSALTGATSFRAAKPPHVLICDGPQPDTGIGISQELDPCPFERAANLFDGFELRRDRRVPQALQTADRRNGPD